MPGWAGNSQTGHGRNRHKIFRMGSDRLIQIWEILAVLVTHGRVINIVLREDEVPHSSDITIFADEHVPHVVREDCEVAVVVDLRLAFRIQRRSVADTIQRAIGRGCLSCIHFVASYVAHEL
jgi:hypothetical protein